MTESARVLFPQPLSPAMPNVSPLETLKEHLSTAFISPSCVSHLAQG